MGMRMKSAAATLLAILSFIPAARADVRLAGIFSSHMVLQQQMPVPVWGWAQPGEQVTVSFADQKQTATADDSGKWQVKLGPLTAGGPHELLVSGKNSLKLDDVLVGEVWICSGQSNMEFPVFGAKNAQQEIQQANWPKIRLFTVPKTVSGKPLADLHGQWVATMPQTVPGFSAVGYFFGRDLHQAIDVPIGLIHTSWGGTPAESWTADSYLRSDPDFAPILQRWEKQTTAFRRQLKDLAPKIEQLSEGSSIDDLPPLPQDPRGNPWRPSGLFNAMIAPIVPFAIRGATWYQGESNADRAYQYRKLLPAMIASWRSAWGEGDFPFLIVSLANFTPVRSEPGESNWAELREAQAMTAQQPHNGLAITIDIGEAMDIHPKDKQTVGKRLALVAEATVYGRDVEYSGPWYDSISTDQDHIVLHFKHTDGGLVSRGGPLKGFALGGEDHKWHWADAAIEGDTVIVHSDQVPHPVAVRYAWADNPICNLYNKAGLPAVPFRTDNWKAATAEAK